MQAVTLLDGILQAVTLLDGILQAVTLLDGIMRAVTLLASQQTRCLEKEELDRDMCFL
jgi:hypothetical protein